MIRLAWRILTFPLLAAKVLLAVLLWTGIGVAFLALVGVVRW